MDVHQASISAAVMDAQGKLIMECVLETKLVVCDPRKAVLLKEGNKSDRIDARNLARLLHTTNSSRCTTKSTAYAA
jgi:hypothetical protein